MDIKPLKIGFRVFIVLMFYMVCICTVGAQTAVMTSGGNATGSGGKASFSVGQIAYINAAGTTGSAAQGVQQPYEISVVTDIRFPEITLDWKIFPNPVRDELKLRIDNEFPEDLSFILADNEGKIVKTDKVVSPETIIPFTEFKAGAYFLRIMNDRTEIKTFKIIKN